MTNRIPPDEPGSSPPGSFPPSSPPPPSGGYPAGSYPPKTNSLAIASLVCSLAGLLVGVSAPVGAVLGHFARRQIRERGEQGDGLALAGIIIGWIITGVLILSCCGVLAVLVLTATQS